MNIVVILSDDHGAWAMGCAGNPEIHTPHMDRLAQSGIRFTNFFCASPVCSPARASLLTGKIPSQHGVMDWIGNDGPEYLEGLTAYTDILAQNGYHCGLSGKWHLGSSRKPQKSFKHWYVYPGAGGTYLDSPMITESGTVETEGYVTDRITDDAIGFMEARAKEEQPFYLSVHYTAPHSPWLDQHPEEIVRLYDDCQFDSCPQEPPYPGCNFNDFQWSYKFAKKKDQTWDQIDVKEYLKGYFAAVTAMDRSIGQIVDAVERLGLREDTLIVYMSDNGFNCGHHGIWGKGNTFPQNMYDTSVKVPAIFSHPGRIPQGAVCEALVSGYDFMPTLLDYAGLASMEANGGAAGDAPGGAHKLPGKSFAPLLLGEQAEEREDVVVFDEYGPVRMIRSRTWKYIHRYPFGPHELFDLVGDPEERLNLIHSREHQDVMYGLRGRLDQWFADYADPRIDGARQPVRSIGQVNRILPGVKAFNEEHRIL